jgi:hypothetical protein
MVTEYGSCPRLECAPPTGVTRSRRTTARVVGHTAAAARGARSLRPAGPTNRPPLPGYADQSAARYGTPRATIPRADDGGAPGTQSAQLVRMASPLAFAGPLVAAALLSVTGCNSTGVGPADGAAMTTDSASACVAAGGVCVSGDAPCTVFGRQECGLAGGFCCLPYFPDAGNPDGGGCLAAGGECLIGNVICAEPGPQSCGGVTPAGLYCCLSNVADCGQPHTTTYACPAESDGGAQSEGGASCTSAPVPLGAPNYQALMEAVDEDASYSVGCKVTFPACNNGHVPYCTCGGSSPGFNGWTCFY